MYSEDFKDRLTELRIKKGVSARDMSLSLGQNPSYINTIESGKALPSMTLFYYICEYLDIEPKDFFDIENKNPKKLNEIIHNLEKLNDEQLSHIGAIIKDLTK